jgi:Family of unknown function (DUF6481)
MSGFKSPDLQQRQDTAIAKKKAMLEKFRAASQDPAADTLRAHRVAVNDARAGRIAEREVAKKVRAAELAEHAERDAVRRALAKREAEQRLLKPVDVGRPLLSLPRAN